MAYSLELAEKIRSRLKDLPGLEKKKMFGGVGFLLWGNMAVGVHRETLMVRFDPEKNHARLSRPFTRPFDLTGRPMKGWLLVEPDGWQDDEQLSTWIQEGTAYALTLPPKTK